jgi:HD-GYP domain-containing protein (c-di-GMP phosphodiesterase class II)
VADQILSKSIAHGDSGVRRAEIIAALSIASDLAVGQPMEHGLRSCVLAMRLGEALGFGSEALSEAYWYALLRHVGCNAESHAFMALFGDEVAFNRDVAFLDTGRPGEMMPFLFGALRRANAAAPPLAMVAAIARGLMTSQGIVTEVLGGHCEVAARLAERLGLGAAVMRDLGQSEERWDGRGYPNHLKGEAIDPVVRLVNFARDVVVLTAGFGEEAALAKVRARKGGAYDPHLVDRFLKRAEEFTAGFEFVMSWDEVLRLEPGSAMPLSGGEFDNACLAMADFTDLKSPYFAGHSRAVAALAREAGERAGLPIAETEALNRAGLLHDIGQSAVSTRIWDKPGALTEREREEVRLHPYYGERVLSRPPALARLGGLVGQHHERPDGSGYHRGTNAAGLAPQARILAAAEAYQSMTELRPHRAALTPDQAAGTLKREVLAGRIDGDAANAVLAAAGHRVPATKRPLLAGLTEREVEVLRLIARGQSMKEIGRALGISPKTVDNHLQRLYPKIEVRTRAGATLFAIEHGLAGFGERA